MTEIGRWGSSPAGSPRGANPARQASLREHNLSLLLSRITRSAGPPSRADLAVATGLTRTTVSALVDQLIAGGLVAELPLLRSLKAGRPAAPLVAANGTMAAVGVEVNVDFIGVRVLDLSRAALAEQIVVRDSRNTDPSSVLSDLADLYRITLDCLPRPLPVAGICLAVPGLVDAGRGPLRLAPNLHWDDVDVLGILGRLLKIDDVPLTVANEANLAAHAEEAALQHIGMRSFFYLSGEIGIGGALAGPEGSASGAHGWSGEIGHTTIDPGGRACSCGATGCLEQYAGQDALLQRAGLRTDQSLAELLELSERGSSAALAALGEAGTALGVALANAVNLLDVDTVVLGGVYAPLAEQLIPAIERQLQQRVLWHRWAPTRVQAAVVRDHAALTGAALAVLDAVVADPTSWMARSQPPR